VNREDYHTFTRQLAENLAQRDDVLGLIAVGSMARRDYQPDEWSDHDFWVIVRRDVQNQYREHHEWLPQSADIIWAFRETEHGVKVLYRSGHLLEYAVFDQEELVVAKANRYRVLIDRAGLAERMARMAEETAQWAAEASDAFLAGQFLTNLLVGVGRYRRGEVLSAHRFVKGSAVTHLAKLLSRHAPTERKDLADDIDPTRRFEVVHPALGQEIEALLLLDVHRAACGLLAIFEREIGETVDIPPEVLAVIKRRLR
jgi:hypothetical protein